MKKKITLEQVLHDSEINTYIAMGNQILGVIGFTEHGFAHAKRSSDLAAQILKGLGYDKRTCELAAIAGYMHDIGNVCNRIDHAQAGSDGVSDFEPDGNLARRNRPDHCCYR